MKREEMYKYVKENIKSYLPKEYDKAQVYVLSVTELNHSYRGLSINRPGDISVATIDLDKVLDHEMDEPELVRAMEEIGWLIIEAEYSKVDIALLHSYDWAKNKLYIKAVGRKNNEKILADIPHQDIEDLAIVCQILLENNTDHYISITVRNDLQKIWGVDTEMLFEDAVRSNCKNMPVKICSLAEKLGMIGLEINEDENPIYLVSNKGGVNGAAAIFYPGVFDMLEEKFGENLYILPSSIHDVMLIPESKCPVPKEELLSMVKEINEAEVKPEERLADSVYFYNIDNKKFTKIA